MTTSVQNVNKRSRQSTVSPATCNKDKTRERKKERKKSIEEKHKMTDAHKQNKVNKHMKRVQETTNSLPVVMMVKEQRTD